MTMWIEGLIAGMCHAMSHMLGLRLARTREEWLSLVAGVSEALISSHSDSSGGALSPRVSSGGVFFSDGVCSDGVCSGGAVDAGGVAVSPDCGVSLFMVVLLLVDIAKLPAQMWRKSAVMTHAVGKF